MKVFVSAAQIFKAANELSGTTLGGYIFDGGSMEKEGFENSWQEGFTEGFKHGWKMANEEFSNDGSDGKAKWEKGALIERYK